MKMQDQLAGVENAGHENEGNAIVWNTEYCMCLSIAEQDCVSKLKSTDFANPQGSDQAVSVSRFASLGQSPFYRGHVTDGDNDTALLFATDGQLELLTASRLIYVDSTFRVVPRLYYQLFTVFLAHVDHSF